MARSSRVRGVIHVAGAILAVAVAFQLSTGCSNSDNKNPASPGGGTPQSTTLVGVLTNGTENAKLTVTINSTSLAAGLRLSRAPAASHTATATVAFSGGGTQSLAGAYDDGKDSLYLAGAGYTLIGTYDSSNDPPSLFGFYSGPNGNGQFGCLDGTSLPSGIEIYLGTFRSDSTNTKGTFNMARWDTLAGAIAFVQGGLEATSLDGHVSGTGTSRAVTLMGGNGATSVTADGTLDTAADTVSGTWHTYDSDLLKGDDGTWSGSLK